MTTIAVILASRGRPKRALGAILAMQVLASGEHDVRYILACDDDDPADTAGFFANFADPSIVVACGPRPSGASACWNRCVGLVDADIFVTMTDDAVMATANWDEAISYVFRHHTWVHPSLAMAALNDTANQGQATLFVFKRAWYDLCGLFDERFPMWFSDTAIAETYSFITGEMIGILPVTAVLKPDVFNPRLRDMRLWWQLYACTRLERIETARKARDALGLPKPDNLDELIDMWKRRDTKGLPDSEEIVRQMAVKKPPDERYMEAYRNAISYVQEHAHAAAHLNA